MKHPILQVVNIIYEISALVLKYLEIFGRGESPSGDEISPYLFLKK